MSADDELRDKLAGLLHARAHRFQDGSVGCYQDIPDRHAPCYVIADEIMDALPTDRRDPSVRWREGWAEGAIEVLGYVWGVTEDSGTEDVRDLVSGIRRRIIRGDRDWRRG